MTDLADCGECEGTGLLDGKRCPHCAGRGKLMVSPAPDPHDGDGQGAATVGSLVPSSPVGSQASALDRSTYLGSSDAPQVAGVSSYGSPMTVWMRKVGLLDEKPATLRMWLGVRLEPIVLELYAARTGRLPERVVGPDDPPILDSEHSFIGAHPDYDRLEIKTSRSSSGWGPDGSVATPDDMNVPLAHYIQAQHQMRVMGWPEIDLAVLIGHDDIWTYTIPADAEVIGRLVIREVELWGHVERGEPPPDDDPDGQMAYIKSKFPRSDDPPRPATPEELVIVDEWRMTKAALTRAERDEKVAATRLKGLVGSAAGLVGEVSWKTGKPRKGLDGDILRHELAAIDRLDIIEKATKLGNASRPLLDKKRTETP